MSFVANEVIVFFLHFHWLLKTSHGGLGVERLLHKKHDSAPVDQIGLWAYIKEHPHTQTTM